MFPGLERGDLQVSERHWGSVITSARINRCRCGEAVVGAPQVEAGRVRVRPRVGLALGVSCRGTPHWRRNRVPTAIRKAAGSPKPQPPGGPRPEPLRSLLHPGQSPRIRIRLVSRARADPRWPSPGSLQPWATPAHHTATSLSLPCLPSASGFVEQVLSRGWDPLIRPGSRVAGGGDTRSLSPPG